MIIPLLDLFFPLPALPDDLVWLEEPFCPRCALPVEGVSPQTACSNCGRMRCYYGKARAPFLARGSVRELVHQFKYRKAFWLRKRFGQWMMEGWERHYREGGYDALVPVPLHPRRRRWREFNQAHELASELSKRCKLPVWNCLRRMRETQVQAMLDRRGRLANLRGAFCLASGWKVSDTRLLVIDDVFTTGGTTNECAHVLKEAGASAVDVLTLLRG